MRALTVRQPWAQLLVTGTKWIETRSRRAPASAIGQRIAITASATRPGHLYVGDRFVANDRMWTLGKVRTSVGDLLPFGAVVGSGVLTASVPIIAAGDYPPRSGGWAVTDGERLWLRETPGASDVSGQLPFGTFEPGRWAYLFADIVPLAQPIPCKGRLGFWTLPDDIAERVEASCRT